MKFCEHNKRYYNCKICYPKGFCDHNKKKSSCKICSKHLFCEHNKRRYECYICNDKLICSHNKIITYCYICNPKNFCEHNKRKCRCKICKDNKISDFIIKDFLSSLEIRPIIIFEYIHSKEKFFSEAIRILIDNKYVLFKIEENLVCFPEDKKYMINFN